MTINEIVRALGNAKNLGDKDEVKRLENRLKDLGSAASAPAKRAAKRVTKAAEER